MKPIKLLRQITVLLIGTPILILGIILVPLPGPGLLVMFAGLFIISLEFEWAEKHVATIRKKLVKLINDATKHAKPQDRDR